MKDTTVAKILETRLDEQIYAIGHASSVKELEIYKYEWHAIFCTLNAFADYYDTSVGGTYSPQRLGQYLLIIQTAKSKYKKALADASERLNC